MVTRCTKEVISERSNASSIVFSGFAVGRAARRFEERLTVHFRPANADGLTSTDVALAELIRLNCAGMTTGTHL